MPIAIIAAAILSLFVAVGVGVKNYVVPRRATPTPAVVEYTPTPTAEYIPEEPLITSSLPPKNTSVPTGISTPASTILPLSKAPTPTALTLTSNTPTPKGDTTPPVFDYMTGPVDGTTVPFNSFCFPMKFSDQTPPIQVRYGLDAQAPSEWNQNYSPCYSSVSNGAHTFRVSAKDGAGNQSEIIKRNFIVDVSNPANQITLTPTPATGVTP